MRRVSPIPSNPRTSLFSSQHHNLKFVYGFLLLEEIVLVGQQCCQQFRHYIPFVHGHIPIIPLDSRKRRGRPLEACFGQFESAAKLPIGSSAAELLIGYAERCAEFERGPKGRPFLDEFIRRCDDVAVLHGEWRKKIVDGESVRVWECGSKHSQSIRGVSCNLFGAEKEHENNADLEKNKRYTAQL